MKKKTVSRSAPPRELDLAQGIGATAPPPIAAMSAAYLLGLGRDAEAEGDGDSAGTSAGVSSSDGRSILLFARGLGAQPADLVRLYEASATAAGRPAGHTARRGTCWAAQAAQGLGPWRRDCLGRFLSDGCRGCARGLHPLRVMLPGSGLRMAPRPLTAAALAHSPHPLHLTLWRWIATPPPSPTPTSDPLRR